MRSSLVGCSMFFLASCVPSGASPPGTVNDAGGGGGSDDGSSGGGPTDAVSDAPALANDANAEASDGNDAAVNGRFVGTWSGCTIVTNLDYADAGRPRDHYSNTGSIDIVSTSAKGLSTFPHVLGTAPLCTLNFTIGAAGPYYATVDPGQNCPWVSPGIVVITMYPTSALGPGITNIDVTTQDLVGFISGPFNGTLVDPEAGTIAGTGTWTQSYNCPAK